MIKFGEVRKPLMIFCLSASIAVHCGAVWMIYTHPISLTKADSGLMMKSAPAPEILVEKMEKALEESLNQVIAASHFSKPTEDLAKKEPENSEPPIEKISLPAAREEEIIPSAPPSPEFASSMPPLFDPEKEADLAELSLDHTLEESSEETFPDEVATLTMPTFPMGGIPTIQSAEDDYTMTDQQFSPAALSTTQIAEITPQLVRSLKTLSVKEQPIAEPHYFTDLQENTAPQMILPNSVDYLRSQWINRSMAEITLPDLDYYGLDKVANSLTWQEDLDVDVTFMPDPVANKYIFSLTFHPELEENYQTMRQNFYFIIDRSSSIDKQKLSRFKMAVQRSFAALCEGDSFNIFFVDKYVTKLSDTNLPVTPSTIHMAEEFLEERQNNKQLFHSLESLLPTRCSADEVHSFIYLTDGQSLHNANRQKNLIRRLTENSNQNIHFYTAASGKGNNLVLLDLLSYVSAGKMLFSDTNAGFPRKLVQLVKKLHHPIVKNPIIEISPSSATARAELHPHDHFLPPMFAGQPYVITGTVDELCDLTLYIQGKNCGDLVNIRKRITLKEAPAGGRALQKLWAESLSKLCYEHFLENGKALYLRQAEQIVAPFHGDIAT